MEKTTRLKFSSDGTEVLIIFADDKESIYFTSKEEIGNALKVLVQTERITKDDFVKLSTEIDNATNLPDGATDKKDSTHNFSIDGSSIFGLLSLLSTLSELGDTLNMPDEEVKEAYFKMCKCGQKHGRIYVKNGTTSAFSEKIIALKVVEILKKEGYISEQEVEKLNAEIKASELEESPVEEK